MRIFVTGKASSLRNDAEGLFAAGEHDSFDLGLDWFSLLAETALDDDAHPAFYACEISDTIHCVLPVLAGRRVGLQGLTTFYTSLFRPLLSDEATAQDLAAVFRRVVHDQRTPSIRLEPLDTAHPSFVLTLDALRLAGLRPYTFVSHGNWYQPVTPGDAAGYFADLSSRVRNTIKRRRKKFFASARGAIDIVSGGTELESAIVAWRRIYDASWKRSEPFPHFMPGLIQLAARRGWLRMGIARYDGEAIAAQIWIVNGGRAAIYKLAYDQAHAKLSAGTLLTAALMERVIDDDRVNEIDYLVGDDAYKKDWMACRRERRGIIAFDPRRARGLAGMLRQQLGDWRRGISVSSARDADTGAA